MRVFYVCYHSEGAIFNSKHQCDLFLPSVVPRKMDGGKVTYMKQNHVTGNATNHHHYHYCRAWVLACVVLWVGVVGAWAGGGDGGGDRGVGGGAAGVAECNPCNSTVEVDNLTLPYVGFVCLKGEALLHAPFTCLVSFRGAFNVTFYLHHIPSSLVVVELRSTYMDYDLEYGEREVFIAVQEYRDFYEEVYHFLDLKLTTLPAHPHRPPRPHALSALYPAMDGVFRGSINLTYVLQHLWAQEEVVGGLEYSHPEDCHYNGVPVLQRRGPRRYEFECRCGLNASGDHCHLGGPCVGRAPCNQRGFCRYIAGESICVCDEGYRGVNCRHHYTSIPAQDATCEGRLECHHHCHLQVFAHDNVTMCSCRAGYRLLNKTHCVPQDEWDVALVLEMAESGDGDGDVNNGRAVSGDGDVSQGRAGSGDDGEVAGKGYKEEAKVKALKVLDANGASAFARKLIVTASARRVDVLVKVSGAALARQLANTTTWRRFFPAAVSSVSTVAPQLSVEPVGAQWVDGGDSLVLKCSVYGGPHLRFTWYKNGDQVFDHNVTNCSFKFRSRQVHVTTHRGATEYSCVDELWLAGARREDGGTYLCRVEDRGYRTTREVVVGYGDALVLLLKPRVTTVHWGENVTLSCLTKNREWVLPDHYLVELSAEPAHAFTFTSHARLPRTGGSITLYGVTEPVRVRCVMREKEGMVWDAGRGTRDLEEASLEGWVYVVTPATPTCSPEHTHGVTWPRTPLGVAAQEQCPEGFQGEGATRACPPATHPSRNNAPSPVTSPVPSLSPFSPSPSPSHASWFTPDFSACVRPQLSRLMTQLSLYKRGYNPPPEGLRGVAKNLLGLLQEGVLRPPLLPGEGASLLRLLDLLEEGTRRQQEEQEQEEKYKEGLMEKEQKQAKLERQKQRQKNRVPFGAFLRVLQVLVGGRDVLRTQDVGELLLLAHRSIRAATEAREDREVRMADLVARVAPASRRSPSGGQHSAFLTVEDMERASAVQNRSALVNVSVSVETRRYATTEDEEERTREKGLKDEEGWRKGSRRGDDEDGKEEAARRRGAVKEEEEEEEMGGVSVGVLVYPHVDNFFPQPPARAIIRTHYQVEWAVASPWVEVVAVGERVGGAASTHTHTNTTPSPGNTDLDFTLLSQLGFSSSSSSSYSSSSSSSPLSSFPPLSVASSSSPSFASSTTDLSCEERATGEENEEEEEEEEEEGEMRLTCARLRFNATDMVELSPEMCCPVTRGAAGERVCTCRGEGLFGLLFLSTKPSRIRQRQEGSEDKNTTQRQNEGNEKHGGVTEEEGKDMDTSTKKKDNDDEDNDGEEEQYENEMAESRHSLMAVFVVCVVSAVVSGVCVVALVPEAYLSLVQLRLLKCVAVTALNLSLAAFTLSPHLQFVRDGAVVVGGFSLVLCMGVGVSQQLALHQHLAVTTQATPIAALTAHTVTLILAGFSAMVGMSAWAVQPRLPAALRPTSAPSWLVVGGEWVSAVVVGGGAGVVTWVWVLLAAHNLRKLSLIREATPQHRSVAMVGGRVAQLTGMLTVEWIVFASSLSLHHTLGQALFCTATLTQSLASVVLYWGSGGGGGGGDDGDGVCSLCWCLRRPPAASNPRPAVPLNDGGGGESQGCMGGLMACSLPQSKTYIARDDNSRKEYAFEFRGRGGSLWSQTTSTVVGVEPSDLLPSPTHSTVQGRRELPLYARGASSVTSGARRPRNLFLRGTNFLCGEDVTSPLDPSLSGLSLDMDARGAGRRQGLCFSFHQPVIHEVAPRPRPSDDKYLDMSIREYMNVLPVSSETRGRVTLSNAKPLKDKEARSSSSSSSYLAMAGVKEGPDKADTTIICASVEGSGVKAAGPVNDDAKAFIFPSGIGQHLHIAPDDGHPAPCSSTGSEDSKNDVIKDTTKDGASVTKLEDDEGTRTGCEENDEAGKTSTRCSDARSRGDDGVSAP